MTRILSLVLVIACGPKTAEPPAPPEPPDTFRREPPPPLVADDRPITFVDFPRELNPRDPARGMIHASAGGGCHVYVRDDSPRPPGKFPPETPIACPPVMRASEWGHCVGSGTISANLDGTQCICQPGDGDPPPKPFRMPCPRAP